MRAFILSIVFCLIGAFANAGTYYVSGAGGTYAAGDGSDGLTWAKAYTTITAALTAMADADTDTIILDPTEDFVQTSRLETNVSSKAGGTLHIKSENSDSSEGCAISGSSGAWLLFYHNETGVTLNLTGLTFKNHHVSVTWGCAAQVRLEKGGNPTLTDIVFDNLDSTSTGSLQGGVIGFAYAGATTATLNTIVIQNCDFIGADVSRGPYIDSAATANVSFVISDLTIQNCTTYSTGSLASSGIYIKGTCTLSGTNLMQNINTTSDTGTVHGFLRINGGTLNMTGSTTMDNIDAGSNTGQGFGQAILIGLNGTGNISGFLEVKNCDWAASSDDRMTGLISSIWGTSDLNMTGPEIYIHDNTGIKGMVVGSQGARFDLDKVQIYDNIGRDFAGAFRMGGWTGCTLKNCLIYNNDVTGTTPIGAAGYIHLHGDATADSTVVLDNCIFYGNQNAYSAGGILKVSESGTSGFDLIVTIRNCIFDDQAEHEIYVDDNNGGDTTLSVTYCDIVGGEDVVTGADTYEHNIAVDPKFYSPSTGNFTLRRDSPLIDQGTNSSATYDYNGYRRPNGAAEDIGAYEYYQKYYGSGHQSVSAVTATAVLKPSKSGLVNVDSTNGNMAVYLPPLELSRGLRFCLHRDNDGANTITVYANEDGETIGGAANKTIVSQYDTLTVWGGTDQWYVQ